MRTALISDIHGNLDALEVVLADIDHRGADRIICLGDTLGYGPDPVACVDLVAERCEWSLMGNHDYGALYEPTNFNAAAEQAAYWTRSQLEQEADEEAAARRWDVLGRLRGRTAFGDFLCAHGSPRRPINEYSFPEDAINSPVKMKQIFDAVPRYCLVGHTHVPGVFTSDCEFYGIEEMDGQVWKLDDEVEKAIINPGSVGQPRDHDPRTSYAILNEETGEIEFFRLEYDIDAVAQKIYNIPDLSNWLGYRLREGR